MLPPVLAQRPWKNLILILLLVLLHGVGEIPKYGDWSAHELIIKNYSFAKKSTTGVKAAARKGRIESKYESRILDSFSRNSQRDEKIPLGVFSQSEMGSFEVHKGHGKEILEN